MTSFDCVRPAVRCLIHGRDYRFTPTALREPRDYVSSRFVAAATLRDAVTDDVRVAV